MGKDKEKLSFFFSMRLQSQGFQISESQLHLNKDFLFVKDLKN